MRNFFLRQAIAVSEIPKDNNKRSTTAIRTASPQRSQLQLALDSPRKDSGFGAIEAFGDAIQREMFRSCPMLIDAAGMLNGNHRTGGCRGGAKGSRAMQHGVSGGQTGFQRLGADAPESSALLGLKSLAIREPLAICSGVICSACLDLAALANSSLP